MTEPVRTTVVSSPAAGLPSTGRPVLETAAMPARFLRGETVTMPPRRRVEGLSTLLSRRADLRGAYAPADYLEEAIRWSA
jgi:hypothetical protein